MSASVARPVAGVKRAESFFALPAAKRQRSASASSSEADSAGGRSPPLARKSPSRQDLGEQQTAFESPGRCGENGQLKSTESAPEQPIDSSADQMQTDDFDQLRINQRDSSTGENRFKCDWQGCTKAFATGQRLRNHLEMHKKKEAFTCKGHGDCTASFRKQQTLQRHIDTVHLDKGSVACERQGDDGRPCDFTCDTQGKLRLHEAEAHGEMRYHCSLCQDGGRQQAAFATYHELQNHLRLGHPPQCAHCGIRCSTSRELRRHMDIAHSGTSLDERRTFVCPEPGCGKAFTKKGNMNIHIQSTHSGRKRFICGETDCAGSAGLEDWDPSRHCGQGFTSKQSLIAHICRSHLDGSALLSQGRRAARSLAQQLTGAGGGSGNLSCWVVGCGRAFGSQHALHSHAATDHGLGSAEIDEAEAEREALAGGDFWIGGLDDAFDYTGVDDAVDVTMQGLAHTHDEANIDPELG